MAVHLIYKTKNNVEKLFLIKQHINLSTVLNIISQKEYINPRHLSNNLLTNNSITQKNNIFDEIINSEPNTDIFLLSYKNNRLTQAEYSALDNNPIQSYYKINQNNGDMLFKPAHSQDYISLSLMANILLRSEHMLEHDYSKDEQEQFVKTYIVPLIKDFTPKQIKSLYKVIELEPAFFTLQNGQVNNLAACNAFDLLDLTKQNKFKSFLKLSNKVANKIETKIEQQMQQLNIKPLVIDSLFNSSKNSKNTSKLLNNSLKKRFF